MLTNIGLSHPQLCTYSWIFLVQSRQELIKRGQWTWLCIVVLAKGPKPGFSILPTLILCHPLLSKPVAKERISFDFFLPRLEAVEGDCKGRGRQLGVSVRRAE